MKVLHCVRNGWRLVAFRGSLYPQRFQPLLCATDSGASQSSSADRAVWVRAVMEALQLAKLSRIAPS
eukprot:COSAG04_NODE_8173_length_1011_cov_4.222588_1_plen_66_part_10